MSAQPFRDAAVEYAAHGFRVLVIPPNTKRPVLRWRHGNPTEVATKDTEEIARRAEIYPRANIGLATGAGFAVVDVDAQHGGTLPPHLPATLSVRTPSGGTHHYYAVTGHVPNSVSGIAPFVDVRGDGGMVLAPPSVVGGAPYVWVNPDCEMAPLQAPVLTPANAKGASGARYEPRDRVAEGERQDELLRCAGSLERQGYSEAEADEFLRELNGAFDPPMGEGELDVDLRGILRYVFS